MPTSPSKQTSESQQEASQILLRVQALCRQAYADGYGKGYKQGFEFGVATVLKGANN